eukprot:PhM_4_TR2886/c0_g1_i1/m.44384
MILIGPGCSPREVDFFREVVQHLFDTYRKRVNICFFTTGKVSELIQDNDVKAARKYIPTITRKGKCSVVAEPQHHRFVFDVAQIIVDFAADDAATLLRLSRVSTMWAHATDNPMLYFRIFSEAGLTYSTEKAVHHMFKKCNLPSVELKTLFPNTHSERFKAVRLFALFRNDPFVHYRLTCRGSRFAFIPMRFFKNDNYAAFPIPYPWKHYVELDVSDPDNFFYLRSLEENETSEKQEQDDHHGDGPMCCVIGGAWCMEQRIATMLGFMQFCLLQSVFKPVV